jgi:hypothetical protein
MNWCLAEGSTGALAKGRAGGSCRVQLGVEEVACRRKGACLALALGELEACDIYLLSILSPGTFLFQSISCKKDCHTIGITLWDAEGDVVLRNLIVILLPI